MDSKQFSLKPLRKKGFGLLFAIMFTGLAATLAAVAFGVLAEALEDAEAAKNKNRLTALYMDLKELLDTKADSVKTNDDLDNFLSSHARLDGIGDEYGLHIIIAPYQDRINYNTFFHKQDDGRIKLKPDYVKLLDSIAAKYGISNKAFLYSLFEDATDEDLTERESLSEVSNYDITFQNGKITKYSAFEKMINYYATTTGDKNIFKVPWDSILLFADSDFGGLDCRHATLEAVNSLVSTAGRGFEGCDSLFKDKEGAALAQKYTLSEFEKLASYNIAAKFWVTTKKGESRSFTMIYDLKTKKAGLIE